MMKIGLWLGVVGALALVAGCAEGGGIGAVLALSIASLVAACGGGAASRTPVRSEPTAQASAKPASSTELGGRVAEAEAVEATAAAEEIAPAEPADEPEADVGAGVAAAPPVPAPVADPAEEVRPMMWRSRVGPRWEDLQGERVRIKPAATRQVAP